MESKFEDQTPTTLEWLAACGADTRGGIAEFVCNQASIDLCKRWLYIEPNGRSSIKDGEDEAVLPGFLNTRGKVRRWFDLHDVPLNEPEEIVNVGPLWAVSLGGGEYVAFTSREGAEKHRAFCQTVVRIA